MHVLFSYSSRIMSGILLRPIHTDRFFEQFQSTVTFPPSVLFQHRYGGTCTGQNRASHTEAAPAFGHGSDKHGGWHTGELTLFSRLDRKITLLLFLHACWCVKSLKVVTKVQEYYSKSSIIFVLWSRSLFWSWSLLQKQANLEAY